MVDTKNKMNSSQLKRNRPSEDRETLPPPQPVSQGAVDRVIDLAFNPTREKIREVTIIDRLQGRFFPQVDMINSLRHYCMEIAAFRQNKQEYERTYKHERPIPPDALDDFMFRTAQWQKSVAGKNLERATDIALAETESRADTEGDGYGNTDAWGKE